MRLHPFMFIARWTFPQFYKQFDCLLRQAKIMRTRFKRCHFTDAQKAEMLSFYDSLGPDIKHVLVAVSYETLRKWKRDRDNPTHKKKRKRGRPPITKETIELVVKIARETRSGYSKIIGHLRSLGIWNISPTTVKNILRKKKLPIAPARDVPWTVRLGAQFSPLIACDFFTHPMWTLKGPVLLYVLFFLNIHTRKIQISGLTRNPDKAWVLEKAKKLSWLRQTSNGLLIRDGDTKFPEEMDELFKANGIRTYQIPKASPNLNPYSESFVDKIKMECLRHFPIIFHQQQLEFVLKEYEIYYNEERPHSAKDFLPLSPIEIPSEGLPAGVQRTKDGRIKRRSRLGGLLNFYYRG